MKVAVPTPAHADGVTGQGECYHAPGAPCGAHRTTTKDADLDRLKLSQLEPCEACVERHGLVPATEYVTDGGGPGPKTDGGITVANLSRSRDEIQMNGGRSRQGDTIRHLANTEGTAPGWLGNPYRMDGDSVAERKRVIAAYVRVFLARVQRDEQFRANVERLSGMYVGCWCRGVSQERTPETWCHLDVVDHWLRGDLSPVYDYLRGDHA